MTDNIQGIELDKATYTSGEQVNGFLYTNLNFDPSGYQLIQKIKGKESVDFWRDVKKTQKPFEFTKENIKPTPLKGGLEYDKKRFLQTNCFLNHMYQIESWTNETQNFQQNKIPISFTLPLGIPTSFKMDWNHMEEECSCKIIYYLKAYLVPPADKSNIENKNLAKMSYTKKLYFDVLTSDDTKNKEDRIVKINEPVKKFGLFFQGYLNVVAKLDKDYYYPDEVANLKLEINNSFTLIDISRIRVTLSHELEVRSGLLEWSFSNKGASLVAPGVKARECRLKQDPIMLKIPLTKVFGTYRNNTQGKLISNKYVLLVEVFLKGNFQFSSKCFKANLDLRIVDESGHNIDKQNQDIPENYEEYVQYTSNCNWNPNLFDPFNCPLTDKYKIIKVESPKEQYSHEESSNNTKQSQPIPIKSSVKSNNADVQIESSNSITPNLIRHASMSSANFDNKHPLKNSDANSQVSLKERNKPADEAIFESENDFQRKNIATTTIVEVPDTYQTEDQSDSTAQIQITACNQQD